MTVYDRAFWAQYYDEGVAEEVEVRTEPLPQLLADAAARYDDKTALRMILRYLPLGLSIQSTVTYQELDAASSRFAAGLQGLGVQPGDRVSLMLPNLPQSVVAYFGVLKAGGIVVNTNPTYTSRELQHQLHDSGARTIVTLSGLYERVEKIRSETELRNIVLTEVSDTIGWLFRPLVNRQLRATGTMDNVSPAPDIYRYNDLVQTKSPVRPVHSAQHDVALFQYTGGTTGRPKAAMLTHTNLMANTAQVTTWFTGAQPGKEKVLGAIPFFHVYGMTVAMLLAINTGAELVIVPDPRDIELVLGVIQREGITIYPGVPAMYVGLVNHPKVGDYDLHSIKACLSGGAALPVEVSNQFETLTGGRLVEGYGMTECSPVALGNPLFGSRKVGTIGVPLPNTEAAIVALEPTDDGTYELMPTGEQGELVVRGPQVMKGYWNQPEETTLTIDRNGWLHTGDIGTMDEDGYFAIVDRKKDLIIASGYNIVPREVEEVLFMHDKVKDAAVVGVPDPKRGETVKAFVVLKEGQKATSDEIIAFCRENLAPYKVPRRMDFRKELPKSNVGKVLRRVLLEEERAGEEEETEEEKAASQTVSPAGDAA